MPSENAIRKKRWQVYSLAPAGNPLFVCSFDLRQEAQRLIDRQEEDYSNLAKGTLRISPPRFVLVDSSKQTIETATQNAQ